MILTKMYLHAYCLAVSIMALMYYTVLSGIEGFTMADIYWRGLCERKIGMDPKKFCREAEVLTLTQATLGMPFLYIALFYLPTVFYVLIINIKKAPKNMKVTEHVVFFILATFTNMFFIKPQPEDKRNSRGKMKPKHVRSSSLPNISSSGHKPWRRSASCPSLSFKVKNKETDQPDCSLFHSNILFLIQFIGFFLIISADVTIMLKREGILERESYNVKYLNMLNVSILLLNVVLWIDLNIRMKRKKRLLPGGVR